MIKNFISIHSLVTPINMKGKRSKLQDKVIGIKSTISTALDNIGVGKSLYKNLLISGAVLLTPLYAGAKGTVNALERLDNRSHIQTSSEEYDSTKDSKTISYGDAVTSFYGDEISQDKIPIIDKNKKVLGYTSFMEGLKDTLYLSPQDEAFYDKETSKGIAKDIREGNNAESFYGDQVLNPFEQPNYTNAGNFTLGFYGPGDADGNDTINTLDHVAMVGGTSNDQTDVNGSGATNFSDIDSVYNFSTDHPNYDYIPGPHWNFSSTSEHMDWGQKAIAIDQTNTIPFGDCDKWSLQTVINLTGIENIAGSGISFSTFDTTMNGRFNLPVYSVQTRATNGQLHAINAFLMGSDPTNFNDWYFFEPQTDARVFPGDFSMDPNEFANIDRYCYFFHEGLQQYLYGNFGIIDFNLTNGNASISWQHSDLVTSLPVDWTYTNITGSNPPSIQINPEESTDPSNTGTPGAPSWTTEHYNQTDNQGTNPMDSTYHNYDIDRWWWAISNYSSIIDKTFSSNDTVYFPNKPPQVISVRDTTNPIITRNQTSFSLPVSQYENGIASSTVTDNCGYWDSTHVAMSNRNPNPLNCGHWNFIVTDSTYANDPTGNDTTDVFDVEYYLDDHYWAQFPSNYQGPYYESLDPSNTGQADAENVNNIYVGESYSDVSTQDPDPLNCGHYNYFVTRTWTGEDTVCYNSIQDVQNLDIFKPNSLVSTNSPPDTIYIGKFDPKDPPSVWEPTYSDTLEPQFPTSYTYEDLLLSATPTDSTWLRTFTGYEDVCNTSIPGPEHILVRDLITGISEGGLEKAVKGDYVKTYPNPTQGKLKVDLDYIWENPNKVNIEVYDVSGRLVDYFTEEVFKGKNEFEIDLSDQDNGLYLIQFSTNNKIFFETEKAVKN